MNKFFENGMRRLDVQVVGSALAIMVGFGLIWAEDGLIEAGDRVH